MTKEIHSKIRELMRNEGVWEYAWNLKIYTTNEFIEEIGADKFSPKLLELLKNNVGRIQKYLDDRILEPL